MDRVFLCVKDQRAIELFATISDMKLSDSKRTFAIAAAAILMCAYQLLPTPTWACTAATSNGFAHSSNTGSTSVTVCAKSVTATRTTAITPKASPVKAPAAKPAPKTTPKPTQAPVKVIAVLTPIKKGVPAALKKPVAKPATKPASKPVPAPSQTPSKITVSTASSATATDEVSFSPAPVSLSASATRAAVGQEVNFWTNVSTHFKTGSLLGKVTEVRFTPIQTLWSSDEGHSGSGGSISLAFDKPGSVEVAAAVQFAVAYQIAGASAWVASGDILVADSIEILIEATSDGASGTATAASARSDKVVRLVGENCLARFNAFGCNP